MAKSKLLTELTATLSAAATTANQLICTEDDADLLRDWSSEKISELEVGVARARVYLKKEETLFAEGGDLSDMDDAEISDMLTSVRESSRKLSIVLGVSPSEFGGGLGDNAKDILLSLGEYLDAELSEKLEPEALVKFLSIKANRVQNRYQPRIGGCVRGIELELGDDFKLVGESGAEQLAH